MHLTFRLRSCPYFVLGGSLLLAWDEGSGIVVTLHLSWMQAQLALVKGAA